MGKIRSLTIEENNRNIAAHQIRAWAKAQGKKATIVSLTQKKVKSNTIVFSAKVKLSKRR